MADEGHGRGDEIVAFWGWFVSVVDALVTELEQPIGVAETGAFASPVLAELDRRILAFGLAWEIGPGPDQRRTLAISPDGDATRLEASREVVAAAPRLADWAFLPARPPRVPPLTFQLHGDASVHEIDATGWRYVLYRWPDRALEIVIEQGDLEGIDDGRRHAAALIALDGLLGEERRLEHVVAVEAVATLDEGVATRATALPKLPDHLTALGYAAMPGVRVDPGGDAARGPDGGGGSEGGDGDEG